MFALHFGTVPSTPWVDYGQYHLNSKISRRLHPGKKPSYFAHREYLFSNHVFKDIKADIGLDFIARTGDPESRLPDSGITNIGIMNGTTFRDILGHSKALVGIGQPSLSPTPYDALCMGVPATWDGELL